MKVFIVLIAAAGIVWYFGFASDDAIFQDYSTQSGSFLGSELCPNNSGQNPYTRGTEEYSGFGWSISNPNSSCIGTTAYRTGCEKQRQLIRAYEECAQKNREVIKP